MHRVNTEFYQDEEYTKKKYKVYKIYLKCSNTNKRFSIRTHISALVISHHVYKNKETYILL